MNATRESRRSAVAEVDQPFEVRFGGWYDGDNYKPGRGWYFICHGCRKVGLGQLLPQSAEREWRKHSRLCAGSCGLRTLSSEDANRPTGDKE